MIFDNSGGQKTRFLDFFKVFFELFRKCFSIVLALKSSFLDIFSALKVEKLIRKYRLLNKFNVTSKSVLSFGVPRMPYHEKNPQDFDRDGGRAGGRTNGFVFLIL